MTGLWLLIANQANGRAYDASSLVESVTYTSARNIEPSQLEFSLLKDGVVDFQNGNTVHFYANGIPVFKGVVLKKQKNERGVISVECADQLYYLKAKRALRLPDMTMGEAVRQLAGGFGLETGHIADTGHHQTWLYPEPKKLHDITNDMLIKTTRATGKVWCLYDDFGKICLTEPTALASPVVLGDASLVYGYDYTTDIKESYNRIRLVRPNGDTGKADAYIREASALFGRWGLLELYEKVDENMTPAQIIAMADTMLDYYARENRELRVKSLGVVGVRGGSIVHFVIKNLGDISLSRRLLIDKAAHKYQNGEHTMDLQARVV